LHQKMDYLYPFREYAPSRQRAAGPSGPFTLDRVRTDAGILSALIFRGVTFGTDFFFQYPIFFNDIAHFHQVKDQATANYLEANGENPPKSYFCDSAAYGPSNHRRVVELADEYANVLRNDSWEAKLQGREKLPFQECFEWLYGCTPTKAVLGPLASYLLTADLVYSGSVESPTVDDMAFIIWTLNKGGARGLELLHLISPGKKLKKGWARPKKKECVAAVRGLYKRILQWMPKGMHNSVGFNLIVLEHCLCKFSRAVKK
ncbi:hypothetical protein B0H10DRAFT_1724327, partial [Mycena sp. CBHHK59/15]